MEIIPLNNTVEQMLCFENLRRVGKPSNGFIKKQMNYLQYKTNLFKQQKLLEKYIPHCKTITEEIFIQNEIKNLGLRIEEIENMKVEQALTKIEFQTIVIQSKL